MLGFSVLVLPVVPGKTETPWLHVCVLACGRYQSSTTVSKLLLLCDTMTANSRAILKCVNSYVYGCRLT